MNFNGGGDMTREESMKYRVWAAITFCIMLVVNACANIFSLNGYSTAKVSDAFTTLITPVGPTFIIWSVIYLGLMAYVVYQLRWLTAFDRTETKEQMKTIGLVTPWFIASSILNTIWIFAWHYKLFMVSLLLIGGIVYSLAHIYTVLFARRLTVREYWFIKVPFSIYFAWTMFASLANASVALLDAGWMGAPLPPQLVTAIVLVIGGAIGLTLVLKDRNIPIAFVLAWAILGVLLRHTNKDMYNFQYIGLIYVCALLIALFAGLGGWMLYKQYRLAGFIGGDESEE